MKRIILVIIFLVIIFLVIFVALREVKTPTERKSAPQPPKPAADSSTQPSAVFHGPTGPPHIIGPTSPPPKY